MTTDTGLIERADLIAEITKRIESDEFVIENENRMFSDATIDNARAEIAFLNRVLTELSRAPEAGWVLVPKEATREMAIAAHARDHDGTTSMYHKIWAAMIAASPAPLPATPPAEARDLVERLDPRTILERHMSALVEKYPGSTCAPIPQPDIRGTHIVTVPGIKLPEGVFNRDVISVSFRVPACYPQCPPYDFFPEDGFALRHGGGLRHTITDCGPRYILLRPTMWRSNDDTLITFVNVIRRRLTEDHEYSDR